MKAPGAAGQQCARAKRLVQDGALVAGVLILNSLLAPEALAEAPQPGAVVATTSRTAEKGARFAPGAIVEVSPGASVTILAPSGKVVTIKRRGPYQPRATAPPPGGVADAVGAMIQKKKDAARRGAARAGEVVSQSGDPPACAQTPAPALETLEGALAAGCNERAERALNAAIAAKTPAMISLYPKRVETGFFVAGMANFDAFVVCRLERAGAGVGKTLGPVMTAASTETDFGVLPNPRAGDFAACLALEAEAKARGAARTWPGWAVGGAGLGQSAARASAPY
jgi:hypothetical protein